MPEPPRRGLYGPEQQDRYFPYQWGLQNIMAPQAWKQAGATGFGITIAVIDTGVDLRHPDFGCPGKLTVLEGAAIGKEGPPQDGDGHGTHVAGIAAACGDDRGVVGVAPDAAVMPIDAVDAIQSSGDLPGETDQAFAEAIDFAVRNGAHVINISLGLNPPEGYLSDIHTETERALKEARDAGVVVVAAAGNFDPFGAAAPSPVCGYPALSKYVLCVGATDRDNRVTYYSYLPNSSSDSEEPDIRAGIVAPGGANRACSNTVRHGIVSTIHLGGDPNCGYERGYAEKDGTSMASPHVAGVAALVYDRLGGVRSEENGAKVTEALLQEATDLYTPGPDPVSGHGLVNALAAVLRWEAPADPDPDPEPSQDPDPEPQPSQDPDPEPAPTAPAPVRPYSVVLSPREVKEGVGIGSELTVSVSDVEGDPVAAARVEWASTGVGRIVDAATHTDEAGLATATLISEEPGDQHVMAWASSCVDGGDCVDEAIRHHGPKRCDIFGTLGDDVLVGTDAADVICAFGGNDMVAAAAGDDEVLVNGGDDRVQGGDGDDRLYGGAGRDRLEGDLGADLLVGGPGSDSLDGGPGMDTCHGSSGDRLKSCRT
ncbi:MAG: S8 family serine peptidase [Actinomycetota bacterium]